MDTMIQNWTSYTRQVQEQYGQSAFRNFEPIIKQFQVQQNFSANNFRSNNSSQRNSVFNPRESNMSRVSSTPGINRVSMLGQANMGEIKNMWDPFQQIAGIENDSVGKLKKVSMIGGTNYNNKEINFEIKLDYIKLKVPLQIYEMLGKPIIFFESLKANRQRLASEIQIQEKIINSIQMKSYLIKMIGFIIIEKEINKNIIQRKKDLEIMVLDSIELVKKTLNQYFNKIEIIEEFKKSKQDAYVFCFILKSMGFSQASSSILKVLKDSLIQYSQCKRRGQIEYLRSQILRDDFNELLVENDQDKDILCKIYGVQLERDAQGNIKKYNKKGYLFPFSQIMQELAVQLNLFIDDCMDYLKGLGQNDQILFTHLDNFYQQICSLFDEQLEKGEFQQNISQLTQTIRNIGYIFNSINHYQKQLEGVLQSSTTREFLSFLDYEKLKLKCKKMLQNLLEQKLDTFLDNYKYLKWEITEKEIRNEQNDFIRDLVQYLNGIFISMKMMAENVAYELIFIVFQLINDKIWLILINDVKKFNIAGLINLEKDVLHLFQACGELFPEYKGLMECFREIRQLLDLFLLSQDVKEILDPSIKQQKYYKLKYENLIKIFPKYIKIKIKGRNEVRRHDIEFIVQKIKQ